MKVRLTQSGGYAGLRMGCTVDTGELPSSQARIVEEAVESGDLFRQSGQPHQGADALQYVIEIETTGGLRKAAFDDIAKSESALRVVEVLRPFCRPVPRLKRA